MSKQFNDQYYNKYLKYKQKYLQLKNQYNEFNLLGGGIKQSKRNKFAKKLNKKNTNRSNSNLIKEIQYKQMELDQTNQINQINQTNLLEKTVYKKHLSEPWFSLISLGNKTVEGRLNKGEFAKMKVGDVIEWHNDDFLPRSVLTEITEIVKYPSFESYLETEGLDKCLPGMPSLEHGLSVYYKYFSKDDESTYGINAIKLKVVK